MGDFSEMHDTIDTIREDKQKDIEYYVLGKIHQYISKEETK